MPRLTELVQRIEADSVRTAFQPIVNLLTGNVMAYEALSRHVEAYDAGFEPLIEKARQRNATWELEAACRTAAMRAIGKLGESLRHARFFINVSPGILRDPRFRDSFNPRTLAAHGLDQSNLVIEITEKESISDYENFEAAIHHYISRGFRVALDDFGSGHSGLTTLISAHPHFLKLDMEITRDVDKRPYKQMLVRSLVGLASNMNASLIAEGVETWAELETLVKLGIRYAQGFLFAKPQFEPPEPTDEVRRRVLETSRRHQKRLSAIDESVGRLVTGCETFARGEMTTEEAIAWFRERPRADHAVIVDADQPQALVTREKLFQVTGWRYGYSLFERRPVDLVATGDPLIVQMDMHVIALARLAMDRLREDLYDPILVVDANGAFQGTVTMKQLLQRSVELELQFAMDANPLTNLPGNRTIQGWLGETLECSTYSVVYADLDHFKEYNDAYGFTMGDEVIRLAANVLRDHAEQLSPGARLGHVGGDDFIVVCGDHASADGLKAVCEEFDRRKLELFNAEDRDRGHYLATNRNGASVQVPLTTISLAVIGSDKMTKAPHPALLGQLAAGLKKRVKSETKKRGRSGFIFERRAYPIPG
ncbi:MAG: EAL and GGDEF domain-containing protein [Planctomycetes bacterium]|nr:EAL and GGDEF domain-containing protein [Planctomycetota bacterium]